MTLCFSPKVGGLSYLAPHYARPPLCSVVYTSVCAARSSLVSALVMMTQRLPASIRFLSSVPSETNKTDISQKTPVNSMYFKIKNGLHSEIRVVKWFFYYTIIKITIATFFGQFISLSLIIETFKDKFFLPSS